MKLMEDFRDTGQCNHHNPKVVYVNDPCIKSGIVWPIEVTKKEIQTTTKVDGRV